MHSHADLLLQTVLNAGVCSIGLQQQVQEQLQVAKAPCNLVQWQTPAVVVHFSQGGHSEVTAELVVRISSAFVTQLTRS